MVLLSIKRKSDFIKIHIRLNTTKNIGKNWVKMDYEDMVIAEEPNLSVSVIKLNFIISSECFCFDSLVCHTHIFAAQIKTSFCHFFFLVEATYFWLFGVVAWINFNNFIANISLFDGEMGKLIYLLSSDLAVIRKVLRITSSKQTYHVI